MTYDCIIIGGGLAGLTAGIYCAGEGKRTLIISAGMNSLHFSSGSIDLWGYTARRSQVSDPYSEIQKTIQKDSDHPYAKVGVSTIRKSMNFFTSVLTDAGLDMYRNDEKNHFHVTGLGASKPTYLSQRSVYNEKIGKAYKEKRPIAVLNFEGYRDFFAELMIDRLSRNPLMKDITITTGSITLPHYASTGKNLHEFRSADLARVFESERYLPRIANDIVKAAGAAELVSLPAFICIHSYQDIHKRLEEMTGKLIYEIPSLPPSLLGMRIDSALKERFAALGGEYSSGDRVTGAAIEKGVITSLRTEHYPEADLSARQVILSTGSFFSGGLTSSVDSIGEPVFNLQMDGSNKRSQWYKDEFFASGGHPFMSYGVATDKKLRPQLRDGTTVKNLRVAGASLSGYDPVSEGSGGGVAISTAYHAALQAIGEIDK